MEIKKVAFSSIFYDPAFNPRGIDPANVKEKKLSILSNGYFDPIKVTLVNELGDNGVARHRWRVVDGAHRFLALEEISKEKALEFENMFPKGQISVNIQTGDTELLRDISNVSNAYARPLTPSEIYTEVVRMSHAERDQREIAEVMNIQQPRVAELLSFQRVIPEAHAQWREGVLKHTDMINLAALKEADQVGALKAFVEGISHEGAGGKAQSRRALRQAAEESGNKRTYVNKGKPTRAKLASYVPVIALQAKNAKTKNERAFYNALAAAFKVVNGELEFEKVSFEKEYVTDKDARAAEKALAEQEAKAQAKAEKAAAREAKKAAKAAVAAPEEAPKKAPKKAKAPAKAKAPQKAKAPKKAKAAKKRAA